MNPIKTKGTYTIEFFKEFTGEIAGIPYKTSSVVTIPRIATDSVSDVILALNKENSKFLSISLDDE